MVSGLRLAVGGGADLVGRVFRMNGFEQALVLLLATTGLSVAARWVPWPRPITYVLGGIGLAMVPHMPRIELNPEIFFAGFLPPLLFSDGWLTPLREFGKALRPITMLATGLVIVTTLTVGGVAHWLIPAMPLALAFALGAVVSPTDAVAVSAVTETLKVPTRVTTVLNGESLMNDATGLVAFKFALAAMVAGTFSLGAAVGNFAWLTVAGLGLGLLVGWLVGRLRDLLIRTHNADALVEITLSLLTPYAAYLTAEAVHASGILAAVAAGLYSGWRDPVKMDAETRQTAWTVWSTILFWLNGLAFVLLGLQFPAVLGAVSGDYSAGQLAGFVAAVAGAAMVLRIAWFFPGAYLPFWVSKRICRKEKRPPWQAVLVGGWAGIRGTVTLAAALSIPKTLADGRPFPLRDLVIFLAFGVILMTLLVQGTTIEWLIRRLGLREDGVAETEDHLARTTAIAAGLKTLRALEATETAPANRAALNRVLAEYDERMAELVAEGETRSHAHERRSAEKRYRLLALEAERHALDDLWRRAVIADDVYRPLQQLLDFEDSRLRGGNAAHGT